MCTVPVVRPLEQGDKHSKLGATHGRRRMGAFFERFLTQNGGLKYACEPLQVRLIVAMVNIDINKGAMMCWRFEAGDHDVSQ